MFFERRLIRRKGGDREWWEIRRRRNDWISKRLATSWERIAFGHLELYKNWFHNLGVPTLLLGQPNVILNICKPIFPYFPVSLRRQDTRRSCWTPHRRPLVSLRPRVACWHRRMRGQPSFRATRWEKMQHQMTWGMSSKCFKLNSSDFNGATFAVQKEFPSECILEVGWSWEASTSST